MNLDALVESGAIRPHVADYIREKTASVVKRAARGNGQIVDAAGNVVTSAAEGGGFDWKQGLGQAALVSAAAFGAPAAINLIGRGAAALGSKAMKPIRFRRMMKEHPDLKEIDPKKLKGGFDTLHNFAPSLAADPNVAASFIRQQGQYSLLGADVARQLVGTQKQLSDLRRTTSPIGPAVPQIGEALVRGAETGESLRQRAYNTAVGQAQGQQAAMNLDLLRQEREVFEEAKQLAALRHADAMATAGEKGKIRTRHDMRQSLYDLGYDEGMARTMGALEGESQSPFALGVHETRAIGQRRGNPPRGD